MGTKEARIARHFIVHGRVQGVGFRAFTVRMAEMTGVSGWVRNRDDGAVEAVACGTPRQVDEFGGYLHQGPRWSEVRRVDVTEHAPVGSGGFEMRH